MKNLINYIIGFALISVLIYVSYYSMSANRNDNNVDKNSVVTDVAIQESTLKIEEQTDTSEKGMIEESTIMMTDKEKTNLPKPEMFIDQNKKYSVLMKTSQGDILIELNPKDAPITVNNFVYLAGFGFYDGLTFHRVINGFMIQGGDPLGNGSGGPGYKFEDEISENNKNIRGSIAMANAGPATNGSQFFINQVDNNFLDDKHTVFGNVVTGIEIVDKIASMESEAPVLIEKVTIAVE